MSILISSFREQSLNVSRWATKSLSEINPFFHLRKTVKIINIMLLHEAEKLLCDALLSGWCSRYINCREWSSVLICE